MEPIKLNFLDGVNTDVSPHLMKPGQYINMHNGRIMSSETSPLGEATEIGGHLALSAPNQDDKTPLGGCADPVKQRIFWARYDANGNHDILCYDLFDNAFYTVAQGQYLAFQQYMNVKMEVLGDLLFFNDRVNPPRRINTEAGIKQNHPAYETSVKPYTQPLDNYVVSVLRNPSLFPPTIVPWRDLSNEVNLIGEHAFRFSFRFVYRDGEPSVFSVWSKSFLPNVNTKDNADDFYNYITVSMPVGQKIAQDVEYVELAVIIDFDTSAFVIKRWDIGEDQAAIDQHNLGVAPLSFDFYNNISGDAVSTLDTLESYHDVPEQAEWQAIARDRIYYFSPVNGKTRPAKPVMTIEKITATVSETAPEPPPPPGMQFERNPPEPPGPYPFEGWIYFTGTVIQDAKYTIAMTDKLFNGGAPFVLAEYITQPGDTLETIIAALVNLVAYPFITATGQPDPNFTQIFLQSVADPDINRFSIAYLEVTGAAIGGSGSPVAPGTRAFKSGSSVAVGLVFVDEGLRNCGVLEGVTNIPIPNIAFTQSTYVTGLKWTLSNLLALTEIPDWAVGYIPVMTQNTRTTSFFQIRSNDAGYIDKDDAEVKPWWFTHKAVYIDIASAANYGIGYVFQEGGGDIGYIWTQGGTGPVAAKVIGQKGSKILFQMKDLGNLDLQYVKVEIYTPLFRPATRVYYERGDVFPILNPGTVNRQYSVLQGVFQGDVRILLRKTEVSDYYVEAMNANDLSWQDWYQELGRPHIAFKSERQKRTNIIQVSEKRIPGTKINGLSRFTAGNEALVPIEAGEIRCASPVSNVQSQGSMLLVICSQHTVSVYIGENQISDNTGDNLLVQSQTVIGTMNVMRYRAGTQDPFSLVEYNGNVYWLDARNAQVCRYGGNGVLDISRGIATELKKYCDAYIGKSQADLLLLEPEQRPFAIGGVDPYHGEYLLHVPTVSANRRLPDLPDYDSNTVPTSLPDPYCFFDNKGKIAVFKISEDSPGYWQGIREYRAHAFVWIGSLLYSLRHGELWIHNQDSAGLNSFYGEVKKMRLITVASPASPSATTPKVYQGISVEANRPPSFVHFRTERWDALGPYNQSSDLATEFELEEGVWVAAIQKDRTSPNASGSAMMKQQIGDKMRGQFLKFMIEFIPQVERTLVKFVTIMFSDSKGHKI
jgi:hypothetical protein